MTRHRASVATIRVELSREAHEAMRQAVAERGGDPDDPRDTTLQIVSESESRVVADIDVSHLAHHILLAEVERRIAAGEANATISAVVEEAVRQTLLKWQRREP
jgi:hypothetical protein